MLKDKNKIKKDSAKLLHSQRSHFEPIQKVSTEVKEEKSKPIDPDVVQIMKLEGIKDLTHTQIVSLIAYLQRVGTDIKSVPVANLPEH